MRRVRPACSDMDPELFFPPVDTPQGAQPSPCEDTALAVCAECPVRATCLAVALRYPPHEQYGVVGGLTAGQRRALLRADRTTDPLTSGTAA